MMPTQQGSFRLFRFFGIQVYLHWSWLLVASYEISTRASVYSSRGWNALEYVSLFVIVLLHEFGHALACRQVGGEADHIVLWPLGGIALVDPPQRPGATLWTIAAGPLVNVALWPVLRVLEMTARTHYWDATMPDLDKWIHSLANINLGLLIFNILPIYPLDGGQIFRSLLWFPFGPIRSLLVASFVGMVGVVLLIGVVVLRYSNDLQGAIWPGLMIFFIGSNCWRAFQYARALQQQAKGPPR